MSTRKRDFVIKSKHWHYTTLLPPQVIKVIYLAMIEAEAVFKRGKNKCTADAVGTDHI